jgi:hypothetical protein
VGVKDDWCNIRVSVPWRGTRSFRDLRIWLIENVKDTDYEFKGMDNVNSDNRIFWFAYEQDAMMFTLIWS